MFGRPSLLLLMSGTAALSIVAHATAALSAPQPPPPATRMGESIKQSVHERDQAAVRRQRALDLREQAARATEERLKSDLMARQATRRAGAPQAEADDQYESLARIYQSMKPAKAAKVFEKLDLDVQMRVAQNMRDRATALILASMTADAAARLSMALARQDASPPATRMSSARP